MSPTHANKRGVRYRYYVSHAILQNRKAEAGSIARVPAPEIETLVCDGPKSLPKLWTSCRRPPDSPRVPCEPVSVCNPHGGAALPASFTSSRSAC